MRATAAQTDKPADKAPSPSFDERRFRHALGRFAARVVDRHPCGDHTLFVGEVLVFSLDERVERRLGVMRRPRAADPPAPLALRTTSMFAGIRRRPTTSVQIRQFHHANVRMRTI
ncbi:hypothetical protein OKW46_001895 [Paraburkholderia sp. WSM4179]|uniref:flavin reductase family protein n=1 Tax=Paraburkholderia sp. WSM4179 TaxID=2991073 RepID=UPI0003655DA6|nr:MULTISPECIES: flavin reductase family protein [Paraburkholderia]MDH6147970.1 hypothetical protein [Paraburkholderia sp. WSM4179]